MRKNSPVSGTTKVSPKILNGVPVDRAAVPYITRLIGAVDWSVGPRYLCTASFITSNQILTAGHCVTREDTLTTYDPTQMVVELNGQFVRVTAVTPYPDFQEVFAESADVGGVEYMPKDLAIVTIAGTYTGPLAVISSMMPESGQRTLLFGFGQSDPAVQTDMALRLGVSSVAAVGTDDKILYSVFDGNGDDSGLCHGDSGGPVLAQMPNGPSLAVVGINSSVSPADCMPPNLNKETLVTDAEYLQWILDTTGNQALIQ